MLETQTVVIGAGVVGLAVARQLALSGREVLVLERSDRIGTGTSSRNSEVVHSGIYYARGSLKARLCVAGRKRLYAYCEERGIPHRRTGKLIIATAESEIRTLQAYFELARSNEIGEIDWRSPEQVRALEPEVKCVQALHVHSSGIIDSHALMTSFWGDLQAARGNVVFRTEVSGGRRLADGRFELNLSTANEPLVCRELVNSAGLDAVAVARKLEQCAGELAPHAYYARGHYFNLAGRSPFSMLVYPIADSAGLGTHVTLDLAGRARFGPDVEWIDKPDYDFDASRIHPFIGAIRRYYPALDADRMQPGYVGVRPKIAPPGTPAADFRIDGFACHGVPHFVNLFGIESPGLTSALTIADLVAELLEADRLDRPSH